MISASSSTSAGCSTSSLLSVDNDFAALSILPRLIHIRGVWRVIKVSYDGTFAACCYGGTYFRQQKHAEEKDNSPSELHSDRDSIASSIHAISSGVVDYCCQKKTNCDGQLISTYDGTANPFRGRLRLVEWNECGYLPHDVTISALALI